MSVEGRPSSLMRGLRRALPRRPGLAAFHEEGLEQRNRHPVSTDPSHSVAAMSMRPRAAGSTAARSIPNIEAAAEMTSSPSLSTPGLSFWRIHSLRYQMSPGDAGKLRG